MYAKKCWKARIYIKDANDTAVIIQVWGRYFFDKKWYKYICIKHHTYFFIFMILIAIYYILAIAVLTLHFTGHLERWGMEWLVFVFAATVFPAVLYL